MLVCCKCRIYWLFPCYVTFPLCFWTKKANQKSSHWNQDIELEDFSRKNDLMFRSPTVDWGSFTFPLSGGWRGLLIMAKDTFLLEASSKLSCWIFLVGHTMASISILLWKKNKNIYQIKYAYCPINHWYVKFGDLHWDSPPLLLPSWLCNVPTAFVNFAYLYSKFTHKF